MVNGTAVRLNSKEDTSSVNNTSSGSVDQHFESSCGLIAADTNATIVREFQVHVYKTNHLSEIQFIYMRVIVIAIHKLINLFYFCLLVLPIN